MCSVNFCYSFLSWTVLARLSNTCCSFHLKRSNPIDLSVFKLRTKMRTSRSLLSPLLLLLCSNLISAASTNGSDSAPDYLNFTAIAGDGQLNSQFQCWQTPQPLLSIPTLPGASYALFNSSPAFAFANFAAHSKANLVPAQSPQWIVILSGLARIRIPAAGADGTNGTTYSDSVEFGPGSLVLATDTKNVSTRGHASDWPSEDATSALMLQVSDDLIPAHTVLHTGACTPEEIRF